jgi:hypothetical protein
MALFDNFNLFGLQIKKASDENKTNSGALSVGVADDGSAIAVASSVSLGIYLDVDGQIKSEIQAITKYRDMALYVEVDSAIQDIINEAIPMETDSDLVSLDLDDLEQPESVKKKIRTEFESVKKLLNFEDKAADMFRRWYVDGKLYFQIIVDKENIKDGIKDLIPLDAVKIKKIKEIKKKRTPITGAEVIDHIEEYFIFNENGFVARNTPNQGTITSQEGSVNQGLKISPDAIIYVPSGYVDQNTGMVLSYLHKAIRPINQLRMLEDATVVYFIARAPERRVFYVDVGNLPKLKAEQYLKDIMNRYRNKMVYDARTGDVRDDKKYMSMLEDFWMPRRDGGKGTEVTSLPGAQNITGYLESLDWFKEKMYEALNVPKSRFQSGEGFNLGRSSEITRDELKFQKFIDRLRNKFSDVLLLTLKTQLSLKGIVNEDEWDIIKDDIKLVFQKDNYFSEFKEQDLLTSRLQLLQQADVYVGKYYDYNWIMKNVLKFTDEEIKEIISSMDKEKDNPRCLGQMMQQAQQFEQQEQMEQEQEQEQAAQNSAIQNGNNYKPDDSPDYDATLYGKGKS